MMMLWAFRSRHYSSDATAALEYEAEALEALDSAAGTALSGASGGTVVTHSGLGADWTPVLGTNIGGSTWLTHTGDYRVWVRVASNDGTAVEGRFIYDVGDLTNPEENSPARLYHAGTTSSDLQLLDLGPVHLREAPTGPHRWQGQVQFRGTDGGEEAQVDKVWLQPTSEESGKLQALPSTTNTATAYHVRDEFNQSSGALTGKTLPTGQTWQDTGDADGFSVNASGAFIRRTATSDSTGTGHLAIPNGNGIAGQLCHVALRRSEGSWDLSDIEIQGMWARRSGTFGIDDNGLLVAFNYGVGAIGIDLYESGSKTSLTTVLRGQGAPDPLDSKWVQLQTLIVEDGRWWVWAAQGKASMLGAPIASGRNEALATGGGVASGYLALYDEKPGAGAGNRDFDDYWMSPVSLDAVIHANQSAELRTEGMFRLDSGGTAYGPVSHIEGDLPRIPPSGLEDRGVELFIKASRGDLESQPDEGIDDLSARAYYRPSWLFVDDS